MFHRYGQRLLDDDVLTGVKSVPRLRVVEEWWRGNVDELHVRPREQRLRMLHVHETEPGGARERRFAMRACDAPQRGPRHLRELLCGEHGEAAEAKDADTDRVCCHGMRDHSCRTTLMRALLIFSPPLYSMNPSLRNLFMKKLTRERVVPTISASISCDIFGMTR